jgi:hypothetical protein
MIEQDTIRLLRECDAGIQMGVAAIGNVLGRVESGAMRAELEHCQAEHGSSRRRSAGRWTGFTMRGSRQTPWPRGCPG